MSRTNIFVLLIYFLSQSFVFSKETVIKLFQEEIELSANESHVIPFKISNKAEADEIFKTTGEGLDILREAKVLKGYDIGYLRIKTKLPGNAAIKIGKLNLKVIVKNSSKTIGLLQGLPEIQTPSNGSFCFGEITVGALVLNDPILNPLTEQSLVLCDQHGNKYASVGKDPESENFSFYRFNINCEKLPQGPLQLTVRSTNNNGQTNVSKAITIIVLDDKNTNKIFQECENQITPEKRLERWGNKFPKLGSNPDASNGQFILNYAADPVNVHEIEIADTGFYQFFLRARGDKAGGAYPSIGIFVDKRFDFSTAGRLVSSTWHRTTLGIPIYLEKGSRQIALRFLNDFSVKEGIDRNLFLDSFEFTKIESKFTNNLLGLEVALLNNIHGKTVRDELSLQGRSKWNKENSKSPPKINLEVNGRIVSSMFASEPHFALCRDQLKFGENKIQLSAEFPEDTNKVYSVAQTVICDEITPANDLRTFFIEYAVLDPIWNGAFEETLELKNQYSEIALVKDAFKVSLKLPDELEGNFTIGLDCRGDNKNNSFGMSITAEGEIKLTDADNKLATGWWRFIELGKIDVKKGNKTIHFKLNRDHLNETQKAQIWIRGLVLRLEYAKEDNKPPMAAILYPVPNEMINGSFMVIAKSVDDTKLDQTELVFDGLPARQLRNSGIGLGYYYFMVPDYMNTPGKHRIMITSKDRGGNLGESRELTYTAIAPLPGKLSKYERALHLSERLCYGADQDVISDILLKGEKKWLEESLNQKPSDPAISCSQELSNVAFPNYYDYNHAAMSVIYHLAKTGNPLQARFEMWAQNHFSTWLNKVEPQRKRLESDTFLNLGITSFRELLFTSATSPAMLYYLDQQRSFAGQYNENYARELLELHTLSVDGGYNQADVTKLAMLITGWMTNDVADLTGKPQRISSAFHFEKTLNDDKATSLLGLDFLEVNSKEKLDRIKMLFELLSTHPHTAEFITKKLLQHYVGENAPKQLHQKLQNEFLRTGGDMNALLTIIVNSDEFYDSRNTPKVCTPIDFTVASMRRSEEPDIWQMHECTRNSGIGLFDRATPDGYPEENSHYADANSLLQRWRYCDRIQWHLYRSLPEQLHSPANLEKEEWLRRMIQVASMNIIGEPLGSQSFESVKTFYLGLDGQAYEKALKLTSFVSKLPEANLR
jgi:hypothetical protein